MPDSTSAITATSATNYSSIYGMDTVSRTPTKTLNQDDFLKLLIAQMTSQDPMSPMKDTDFSAQMAQFSALEQTRAMQTELAQMREDQQFLQANDLIGRTVEIKVDDKTTVSGVVQSMRIEDNTAKIVVNGKTYDLSKVLSVAVATPTTATETATETTSTNILSPLLQSLLGPQPTTTSLLAQP